MVVVGEGRMLQDFDSQLVGMKAGESKSFELRFPDDYHASDVAGKTATFQVSVSEVAAPRLPDVDAEFAKALGIADGDTGKMRDEVRTSVRREVQSRLKARLKDQVMQLLLDRTAVEAPKALVEAEVQRLQSLMRQDFAARGIPVEQDLPFPPEIFQKQAERRVTLGLILVELVKAHQLQAKPEQVKAIVEEQAQSYENPQEVVRFYYQSPERLREIESMVLEDNVVEWVLKTAQVEEKPVEFDELMGNRQ
jgi:trigger factor